MKELRMETLRKITISVDPPQSLAFDFGFLELVKATLAKFLANGSYTDEIGAASISFAWYDDSPTSNGVGLTVTFCTLRGVDLVGELVIVFRKAGYVIRGVNVGY
jgi:hypothetical protein